MNTHLVKICSLCDKVFGMPFLLRKHMAIAHISATTLFLISAYMFEHSCDPSVCDLSFKDSST